MYIRDHVFSRTKKDPRPGVMPIISRLVSDSVKNEKRKAEASSITSTVGAFSQEFQSAPFERSNSGTTLCSQTARKNLYTLL